MSSALEICHRCPHRQRPCSGPCACFDGIDIIEHAAKGECPKGLYTQATADVARPALRGVSVSPVARMQQDGPALWREIHTRVNPDAAWFATVIARLPCGSCKADTLAYAKDNPPDFGPGYPVWAWRFHNYINAKLGKPQFPPLS